MKDFGTGIILAGGQSSRMGFDKQFLKINNRRIIDDLTYKLEKEFEEIIIVTNKPGQYQGSKHRIVTDIIVGKGPLSGIHVGLKESSSNYAFVIGCDMPNVNIDYIRYMKDFIGESQGDGCITSLGNSIEPFHGFYSKNIIGKIESYLSSNRRSIAGLINELNFLYIGEDQAREFSPGWDMFSNLNTLEDINRYIHGK